MLEKRKQTSLEKYGYESPNQDPIVRKKMHETKVKNGSYEVQKLKSKITKLERYGDETFHNVDKFRQTIKNYVHNFEVENNCTQLCKVVQEYGQGLLNLQLNRIYDKKGNAYLSNDYIEEFVKNYKGGRGSFGGKSVIEKDIVQFISSIYDGQIVENCRKIISDMELDVYLPELNIGIEFNGTYWHSFQNRGKDYHQQKSIRFSELGVRVIHIYEYEWTDVTIRCKIEDMLRQALNKSSQRVYARKCKVKEITNQDAKKFNNDNHLSGHRNAQITLGLFYDNELIQLMSFSNSKYNRNLKQDSQWEIIRSCTYSDISVVGGISKLFNFFVNKYNPTTVFSYCDFNKFDGKGYEKLGMTFDGYTVPDMKWILKGGVVVNRQPSRHKELKEASIDRIYGAGSKKYIWRRQ